MVLAKSVKTSDSCLILVSSKNRIGHEIRVTGFFAIFALFLLNTAFLRYYSVLPAQTLRHSVFSFAKISH